MTCIAWSRMQAFDKEDAAGMKKVRGEIERAKADMGSLDEQQSSLMNFHGKGWYEKEFMVPLHWEGQKIYLRFGSIAGRAQVFVNGHKAAEHVGTALPLEAEISALVAFGEMNRVVVLADSTLDPWSLPPALLQENEGRIGFFNCYPGVSYDFFPYGGIQRSVYLYTAAPHAIQDITIRTEVKENEALVHFSVSLTEAVDGQLTVETDGLRQCVPVRGNTASGTFTIREPRLWDVGKPELYTFTAVLAENGKPVDQYTETYGIRTVQVVGDQFLLNGKPVFFKGFGKHEDFYIVGKGFQYGLMVKDFSLLKWVGANSFRTSHYPYDERILEFADRNGILIIDETPFVGLSERMYTEPILEKAVSVIHELIERDKNHPSVVLWSLANEPNVNTPEGKRFFEVMAQTARALDPTRPITYVAHMEPENNLGYLRRGVRQQILRLVYRSRTGGRNAARPGRVHRALPRGLP